MKKVKQIEKLLDVEKLLEVAMEMFCDTWKEADPEMQTYITTGINGNEFVLSISVKILEKHSVLGTWYGSNTVSTFKAALHDILYRGIVRLYQDKAVEKRKVGFYRP